MTDVQMKKILVIEDDPSMRLLISKVLLRFNYIVETAKNGRDMLSNYIPADYDMIITDIFMPEMDGYESIAAIRKDAPQLPILAISAGYLMNAKDSLYYAKELGANDVLVKPFSFKDLKAKVEELIGE